MPLSAQKISIWVALPPTRRMTIMECNKYLYGLFGVHQASYILSLACQPAMTTVEAASLFFWDLKNCCGSGNQSVPVLCMWAWVFVAVAWKIVVSWFRFHFSHFVALSLFSFFLLVSKHPRKKIQFIKLLSNPRASLLCLCCRKHKYFFMPGLRAPCQFMVLYLNRDLLVYCWCRMYRYVYTFSWCTEDNASSFQLEAWSILIGHCRLYHRQLSLLRMSISKYTAEIAKKTR